ncbi:hypothetical protein [Weissella cibaria]|uniref:DUF1640 domain-containing protein n=1 Tax=Weissella cibaria TaxID=137591 RepID=A0A9Q8N8J5_9LACO|nr:hypothetical protein [Weissella cibaria]QDG81413.1 hypothetical protein Wei3612_08650 [Weissella cibaria]QMU88432.1 hypothetical protein H3N00_10915 [Weissella cibaria]TVV26711.1 hypothetical protein FO435_01755 [Weissella cibaria]TVV35426.1 hypothetical protein FO439_01775 [Weissella cibaria]TVV39910.1 hypothetical protein FO438_01605 [Weissella cibaria]
MDEKYVTKLEFQAFRDGEFEALRSDVRELQVDVRELQDDVRELRTEFTEFRAEMRGDMKVLNVRMDNMARNFEKSNTVMMWVATVYAVPMLFMMYKILVGTN